MFSFIRRKNSELESLRSKVRALEKNLEIADAKYSAELKHSLNLRLRCSNYEITISDLEAKLLKYKELYVDELQKRLALAEAVRESEIKVED